MPQFMASGALCCGPSLLSCIALILSIFANSRCYLVTLRGSLPVLLVPPARSVGLWCYEARNGLYYDIRDYEGDSKFEAARALGTTSLVIGFVVWLFYLFAACIRFGPLLFRLAGTLCTLNCLFQGLVFLVYRSAVCQEGCDLGTGGRCGVAATVFWFVAGCSSNAAGKAEEADSGGQEGGAEGGGGDDE